MTGSRSVAAVVVLIALAAFVFLPVRRVANSLGYALPGSSFNNLPGRIHYGGRDYENPWLCDGQSRCTVGSTGTVAHRTSPPCNSQTYLRKHGFWPLHQVATIPTLFGPAHSILAHTESGFTTMVLYVPHRSCYIGYELSGGP